MATKEEVLCSLNRWQWPPDIGAFTAAQQQKIMSAAFSEAQKFCPQEKWLKTWRKQIKANHTRGEAAEREER